MSFRLDTGVGQSQLGLGNAGYYVGGVNAAAGDANNVVASGQAGVIVISSGANRTLLGSQAKAGASSPHDWIYSPYVGAVGVGNPIVNGVPARARTQGQAGLFSSLVYRYSGYYGPVVAVSSYTPNAQTTPTFVCANDIVAVATPGVIVGGPKTVVGAQALARTFTQATGTVPRSVPGGQALARTLGQAGTVSVNTTPVPRVFAPNAPSITVLIDVTNAPTNPVRVWTDITAYVRAANWARDGRSNETERTQTGQASIEVNNRDGRFNRSNVNGAYYPNLRTTRWVKIQATWQGITYDRWSGLTELISLSWEDDGFLPIATITASTILKVANLAPLDGLTYDEQLSGARVAQVLTDVGLPASTLDTGFALLPAFLPAIGDNVKALAHLQDIEGEEGGLVFSDGSGLMHFQDRHHRFNAVTAGTIGDILGGGALAYGDPSLDDDDQFLFNSSAKTTADGNSVGTATDDTSVLDHFERLDSSTLLTNDPLVAQAAAEAFVLRYKEPAQRVNSIRIIGQNQPSLWPTVLTASNSDRFCFQRHFPNAGTVTQLVHLEKISESVTLGGKVWETRWLLSPGTVDAYMASRFWVLEDLVLGRLDFCAAAW